jgi:hypothetical protein
VLPLRSVRTRCLCLFTCNGVSVAGDIYPSTSSLLLSAAQGFPRAVITTDRRVMFDRRTFQAVMGWMRAGASPVDVTDFLNGIYERTLSARPIMLFGDPMAPPQSRKAAAMVLSPKEEALVIGASGGDQVVRTARKALLVRSAAAVRSRLVDRTSEFAVFESSVRFLRSRLWRAQHLTSAMQTLFHTDVHPGNGLQAICKELLELKSILEQALANALRMREKIQREGVWDSAIADWTVMVRSVMSLWDAALLSAMEMDVLQNEPERVFRDGYETYVSNPAGPCSRCRCVTQRETANAPNDVSNRHQLLDCPVCGPHEAWEESYPRLTAALPERVTPCDVVQMRVTLAGQWPRIPILPEQSHFLIHLKDTGRGIVPFRHQVRTHGRSFRIAIPFGRGSAPEMHSVRVLVIRGITVAYLRLRTACVP